MLFLLNSLIGDKWLDLPRLEYTSHKNYGV